MTRTRLYRPVFSRPRNSRYRTSPSTSANRASPCGWTCARPTPTTWPLSARNWACTDWPSRRPVRTSTSQARPVRQPLFVTAYAVTLDMVSGELDTFEVAVFVTHSAVVTVRKSDQFDIEGVVARWDSSPDLAKHEVSFLLHGLLDFVVDGHFSTVQTLDDEIETLEDLLFDDGRPDVAVQRRSFELRKSLVQLRRVVLPMREVVNSVMRRGCVAT